MRLSFFAGNGAVLNCIKSHPLIVSLQKLRHGRGTISGPGLTALEFEPCLNSVEPATIKRLSHLVRSIGDHFHRLVYKTLTGEATGHQGSTSLSPFESAAGGLLRSDKHRVQLFWGSPIKLGSRDSEQESSQAIRNTHAGCLSH